MNKPKLTIVNDSISENKFVSADNRFVSSENKFVSAENRFVSSENKFVSSENKFVSSENRFVSAENKFVSAENKFVSAENRFVSSENTFSTNENKVGTSEHKVESSKVRYTISTLDDSMWQTPQPVKTKNTKTKPIIHPLFISCIEFIKDPFWEEKFTAAAYNKFPKGFTYYNGILSYQKGQKVSSLNLPKNPIETAYAFKDFLNSKAGIISEIDQINETNLLHNQIVPRNPVDWKSAKSVFRECMIYDYVSTMRKMMTLSKAESDNLLYIIKKGINGKYFTKDNIFVINNRIYNIDGLLWNETLREFYINPLLKPIITNKSKSKKLDDNEKASSKENKDTIPEYSTLWIKYLKNLESSVVKYESTQDSIIINHVGAQSKPVLVITASTDNYSTNN
jgi:hypothetical protein